MALLATIEDPQNPGSLVHGAYVWFGTTSLLHEAGTNWVQALVHRSKAAAYASIDPMLRRVFNQGDILRNEPLVVWPSVEEVDIIAATIMENDPSIGPFIAIKMAMYQFLAQWEKLTDVTFDS